MRAPTLTHLVIAHLDPLRIEAVAPKVAATIVRCVLLAAVNAAGWVRARGTLRRRRNWGGRIRIPPTTAGKGTVVLLTVRAQANGTFALRAATGRRRVTPAPAARAQGDPGVSPGSPERSDKAAELNRLTDEDLGPGPADGVSDVQVYRSRVRLRGITDHPRGGLKHNVVPDRGTRSCDLPHDDFRRDGLVVSSKRNVDQLKV